MPDDHTRAAPAWLVSALREPNVGGSSSADALTLAFELLAQALAVPEAFPWQCALLERFLRGELPDSLDIPTGLGKTAVMAVWLVARAMAAPVPRRLVYVVDRRAVVDQATEVAQGLRDLVSQMSALREQLGLAAGRELPISTLRGQFADNREWLADPTAPAIVVGTVDMVGSRLLFEGYGVSRKVRSFHAGMLGADTLLVLDEAHLVPAFESLTRAIAKGASAFGPPDALLRGLIPAFRLLSLSATGKADTAAFRLTAKDHDHPIVLRRLQATKRLVLRPAIDPDETSLPEALANDAWELSEQGARAARILIFCHGRGDAQKVHQALSAKFGSASKSKLAVVPPVELLVGERRVYERQKVAEWLKQHGFIAGSAARPDRACFLVATAAGEVGIDLDADHMVSDLVAWERMVQRLGRVNRRGEGDAQVPVLPCLPNKKERAALEKAAEERSTEERSLVSRRQTVDAAGRVLRKLPLRGDGTQDASPGALGALKRRADEDAQLKAELDAATTPAPLAPALSRAVVEAWSMTSLDEHTGRPEVQPWLRGWVDDEPQTQIVWRKDLPVTTDGDALELSDVEAFFDAAGPHLLETLEVETARVLPWLTKRVESIFKRKRSEVADEAPEENEGSGGEAQSSAVEEDAMAGPPPDDAGAESKHAVPKLRAVRESDVVAFVLRHEGNPLPVKAETLLSKERAQRRELADIERQLPGATIVVLDRLGGLSAGLLDDRSETGEDVATAGLRLPFLVESTKATGEAVNLPEWPGDANEWRKEMGLIIAADHEGVPSRLLLVWSALASPAATEDARSVGHAQLLDEHQAWAEAQGRRIADALGLPPPYQRMLTLAARLHDEGKAADRWQRAFKAKPGGPWGKTESRPNQHLLDGYRHELGSLLMVERREAVLALDPDLRDLCLHLIAAHHGHARPSIRTDGCETLPPSALQEKAQEVALRFTRLEKRWGPWGLAWWETLLRAADQEASRLNDARGKAGDHG